MKGFHLYLLFLALLTILPLTSCMRIPMAATDYTPPPRPAEFLAYYDTKDSPISAKEELLKLRKNRQIPNDISIKGIYPILIEIIW